MDRQTSRRELLLASLMAAAPLGVTGAAASPLNPVWTALYWQGFLSASATLVGAAMCPTCLRGTQSRWP
jgi:hypothetical protein